MSPGSPLRRAFALESVPLTVAYWGAAALFAAAFFLPKFPPLIDYPNHLAIAVQLHRLWTGGLDRSAYDVSLFTHNGAFHVAVALLSFVVRPEVAGRIFVAGLVLFSSYAVLRVTRALGRPGWLAFVPAIATVGHGFAWGFLNFSLGLAGVFVALARFLEVRRGERSVGSFVAVATVLPFLHILAPAVLGLSMAAVVVPEGERGPRALGRNLRRWARELWPLAPSALVGLVIVEKLRRSPHTNWENASSDGHDVYPWQKLLLLPHYLNGNFSDGTDQLLVALALAIGLVLVWSQPVDEDTKVPRRLLVLWAFVYVFVPRVVFATWFVFDRLGPLLVVFGAASLPAAGRLGRLVFPVLTGASAANTAVHFAVIPEEGDAEAILADIPTGRRVLGLMYERTAAPVISRAVWMHLPAYYTIRRNGEVGETFLVVESMPLHYRAGQAPPRPPWGIENAPEKYDPHALYARHFDLLLVRCVGDPRPKVLPKAPESLRIVAHHGLFWLLERK